MHSHNSCVNVTSSFCPEIWMKVTFPWRYYWTSNSLVVTSGRDPSVSGKLISIKWKSFKINWNWLIFILNAYISKCIQEILGNMISFWLVEYMISETEWYRLKTKRLCSLISPTSRNHLSNVKHTTDLLRSRSMFDDRAAFTAHQKWPLSFSCHRVQYMHYSTFIYFIIFDTAGVFKCF